MESEECAPITAVSLSSPPSQHQPSTGRNRKRGGLGLMSSSVEAHVASHHHAHHHDKVLRSHTRRGRGAGPVSAPAVPPISVAISRRRARTSCCSSHTDEDEGGGGGGEGRQAPSVNHERGAEGDGSGKSDNNNKKAVVERRDGGEQAVIIPSSPSCFAPTNETKELCKQAGLLGGTTLTPTIHSGSTRLSSSCIPPNNELATQQCQSDNAGEHGSSSSKSNDNMKCSQKTAQGMVDNNAPRSRRRSRQHGHHHHDERSTPPAGAADGDDNVGRGESGDDNDEMCGEDAASCEVPGKPNAAQLQSTSLSLLTHTYSPSSSGALSTSGPGVKSERGASENNGGKEKEEKNIAAKHQRSGKEQRLQRIPKDEQLGPSVSVKKEIGEITESIDIGDLTIATTGALKINKIGGHDDRWSAGEDAKPVKEKDGERKVLPASSSLSVVSSGGVSMPQKAGVKLFAQDDGGICVAAGKEQSRSTKTVAASGVSVRCVKKCASGTASGASKKQSTSASCNNNNNINIAVQSVGKSGASGISGDRKKTPVSAPMLFMNNLPYMGELTFDTRPRRGRKPKKADICHLISKNYGIQFPAGVTQATLSASLPIIASKPVQASSLSSASKKAAETITVTTKNNSSSTSRSVVPPTFCNRDVSIVPIIPTTWSGSSGAPLSLPIATDNRKCSSSPSNLLKPLSSLAQQLMLHHHQNSSHTSVSPSRSMAATATSSSQQQAISMFPLPSSYAHTQQHSGSVSRANRSKTYSGDPVFHTAEDEDENMMEVDVESQGGDDEDDDEDNQDSPLNLCMRDKTIMFSRLRRQDPLSLVKDDSLDVRWSKSGGGANKGGVRSCSSNSYSFDGANKESGSNKRSMTQGSSANPMMKGGKSAKLTGNASRASSSSINFNLANSNNHNDSDSVSNLVNRRPSPSPASSPFGNAQQPSKLSPNIFAISAHHLQPQGPENAGKSGGKGKQVGQGRKKRDVNLRGDISISTSGSPGSQSGSGGTPSGPTTLSSFGGTLFGQSTAGINDSAEVSICKFKFTGGAKPCLQEKKMLSVDSGGNFRFYSDKTSGPGVSSGTGSSGKLPGKGQQQLPVSSSSGTSNALYSAGGRTDLSQSPPSTGDGIECHYALSSLPKSAKSMSMCMPQGTVSNSGIQVQMSTTSSASASKGKGNSVATKLSLPLIPSATASSASATAGASNPYASLSISPTTEELHQLHLSMQDQAQHSRSSSRVSPYPPGDFSYSSSNSCSSSDNCFEGNAASSSSVKANRQSSSSHSHNYRGGGSSSKMKLKRKRRTRKSLMREKLEKTFKEKGFLIQTQQLESAEGATYCKFRQLRKFTRYLFRSWKDYLPDHVKEISDNNANNNNGAGTEGEQALANSHPTSNSTDRDGSNVQSIADDEVDVDDDEDDVEEDDEVDSSEDPQPRQSLISQEEFANDEDPSEDDDDNDGRLANQRVVSKGGRRRGNCSAAVGNLGSVTIEECKMDSRDVKDDVESNKDDDSEDVELQVDA